MYTVAKRIKQGTIIRYFKNGNKNVCMYCGRVYDMYLLFNSTKREFELVGKAWIKNNKQNIKVVETKESQYFTVEEKESFRKRIAQNRKERYLLERGITIRKND